MKQCARTFRHKLNGGLTHNAKEQRYEYAMRSMHAVDAANIETEKKAAILA